MRKDTAPHANPYVAVIKVTNGYILCENEQLVPSEICMEWQEVIDRLFRALHPDTPHTPADLVPRGQRGNVHRSLDGTRAEGGNDTELLTADELATRLRVKIRTVRAWTHEGMPHLPVGRKVRYRMAECERWLQERQAQRKAIRARAQGLQPAENQLEGAKG